MSEVNISQESVEWMFNRKCVEMIEEYGDTIVDCDDPKFVRDFMYQVDPYDDDYRHADKFLIQLRWYNRWLKDKKINDWGVKFWTKHCSDVKYQYLWKPVDDIEDIDYDYEQDEMDEEIYYEVFWKPTGQVVYEGNVKDFNVSLDWDEWLSMFNGEEWYNEDIKEFVSNIMNILMDDMNKQLIRRQMIIDSEYRRR